MDPETFIDAATSGRSGRAEQLPAGQPTLERPAGAELEPRFHDVADGPLAEWLQSTSIASPNE